MHGTRTITTVLHYYTAARAGPSCIMPRTMLALHARAVRGGRVRGLLAAGWRRCPREAPPRPNTSNIPMDATQRYQFDLHGFLLVEQALSTSELQRAARAAHAATSAGQTFGVMQTPELASMPFHAKIWPVVLQLTVSCSSPFHSLWEHSGLRRQARLIDERLHLWDGMQGGKPMMRHSFGIHNHPQPHIDGSGGGPLHCNRESHRSSVFGSPNLGHALNGTHIQDGKPYSTDFVCFIYLDTVHPGDGGLLLVPGSFKSNFERPATMFGPYGRAHHGPPEGIAPEQGHVPPPMQPGVVPEHTVNVCPQAGDFVWMDEGTSHATMPWVGAGHRHVLALRFKPHHCGLPDDHLVDESILALPPELRDLRSTAPVRVCRAPLSRSARRPDGRRRSTHPCSALLLSRAVC
jgi:hypothetical protein